MPRTLDKDLLDCLRRANPYTEYRVEISEPDVGQVLRRSDQFTAAVSMSPALSLSASPRGPLTLTPTSVALADFTGVQSDYDLNGEAETRRLKGLAWKLDSAFNRAALKSVQARVKRIPLAGFFFPADFELQVFKITKTPGVMQSNVGTPQYQSTVWTEYSFSPLLNPAPVIKYASIAWDGSQNATLNFDVANWGLILDNSLVRAASPNQVGELPEYLIVVRLTGKAPSGTGHFKWYLDTASSRTIAGVGTFERVWWARDNDQQQWVRNAFADVPSVTVNVEAYPASGSAIYLLDLGAVPKAVSEGRIVFERAVPPSTTATLELSTAGSGGPWTVVKHGDPVIIKQQTYHLRVTETTDAALRATPAVNAMGIEFRTPRDVSIEAIPQLPTREVDLPWGAASIPEGKIRVVKTGKKDYLDVATSIGSSSPASRLEADIYLASRHPLVTRDKWHRLERMMVTNRMPSATSEEFTLLSYASRLKRKIPSKVESLNSVHTVQAGSTASQLIVLPILPGTTVSGNEYDGKNYYMRVRTTAAPNTSIGMVAVIQGNTSTDRLDFSPVLSEALVTGDVIEVHSGIYNTQVVSWSDYDPADVWWEVLTTHLAIAPERIGAGYLPRGGKPPKVTDRAPGDATTQAKLKVTGRISEQESADEILDQLSAIMGGVTMELDGQIVFVQLLPLRNVAGEVTVPLPPSVATLDARDILSLSTPPGLEKRSTILSANYGVPATAADPNQFPSRTTTATDGDALLWLAQQDLEDLGTAEVPKEIARWFYNSSDAGLYLASVFNAQIVKATSTGLRVFPTTLAEKYPEFLPGDVLVVHTSQYTDYDPSNQTQLKGSLAIRGVIVKLGGEGRQLGLFVPGLADNVTQVYGGVEGANTGLGAMPAPPALSGYIDGTGQLVVNSIGDGVTASHKIAWVIEALMVGGVPPSDETVRAAPPILGQSVVELQTGFHVPHSFKVAVAAFAYSANGIESFKSIIGVARGKPVPVHGGDYGPTEEERKRSGGGGYPVPGRRFNAEPLYEKGGFNILIDPEVGQVGETLRANDGEPGIESQRASTTKGARSAGTGSHGITEEESTRSYMGGYGAPDSRFQTQPYYDRTGLMLLVDPVLRRFQAALLGPTGIAGDVIERGGSKGDQAIDSGISVVASAIDMARAFLNKHLGNISDDATSDRRAATLIQKTGGDRGAAAIDSGNIIVTTALDLSRSYVNKHLGFLPDDATSDRRAVTLVQRDAATRADAALDGSSKLQTGVTAAAKYADGTTGIDARKPAEAGANVTETHTSADTAAVDGTAAATVKGGAVRANTGLDATGKLQTGVTVGATAADGEPGIESQRASERNAAEAAGTGASGITEEEWVRGGCGGSPVPGGRVFTLPVYSSDGSTALLDTLTRRIQAALLGPAGTAMGTVETGANRALVVADAGDIIVTTAIDFARGYLNKHLGNIADDATSDRRATTLNEKTGAARAYAGLDASNKLATGIAVGATYADGVTGIDALKPAEVGATKVVGLSGNKVTQTSVESRFRCQVRRTAAQSIPDITSTALAWTSESYDIGGLHSNVSNNSRITIPAGGGIGVWFFTAAIDWAPNATGERRAVITKNGAAIPQWSSRVAGFGGSGPTQPVFLLESAPADGDYFEVFVYQDSGAALNVDYKTSEFSATHLW